MLTQTYEEIECIVVVDASEDGTQEYLKSLTDPRVRTIFIDKEESKGGNYARNKGIQAAKGEFLALLDDDDEWFPTKIEQQIKLFENPEIGLVYCGHVNDYDENGLFAYTRRNISREICRRRYLRQYFVRLP